MRTVVRAATLLLWSLAIANPAIAQTSARPDAVSARAGTAPPRVSRIVVDAPDIDFEVGVPIRIGQRLLSVAPRTGHLVLRDLRSGERTVVPMGGSVVELGPASPDQRAVAYTGCAGKGCNDYELRTINLDGTKSRTVIAFGGKIDWITPYSWSPDGRQLLGVVNWSGGRRQIVFVSVADGEMRVAKDLDWRQPSAVALSPSGRYIVYDAQPEREKGARDLVVLDVKTHAETRVTTDGVPKAVVGWSAGGSGVFYTTVDADSATLWFVPVRNGRQSGSSRVIHRDLAAATDFRVVGSSVVFLRGDTRTTIYELPVDLETGQAGTPRPIISSSQISERAILSPAEIASPSRGPSRPVAIVWPCR